MRRVIAAAMSRSNREIPHYYLDTTIDLGPALDWLREQNLARPLEQRLLPGVLMLRATALALREVPQLNGHWVGDAAVTS
jgi:pyruvate dehydrogenase E2 component (dihydrolipoamide acetyltransferase)